MSETLGTPAAAASEIRIGEAQQYTLAGDVLTQGTASVAGLTVTLTGGSYTKTAKVSADGSYVFADVPVGSYTLTFAGNQSLRASSVPVEVTTFDPWISLKLTYLHQTPEYVPGDVDEDGHITAADARLALRAAVGLEKYAKGSVKFRAADASKDGVLKAEDARLILRAAVGLERLK